jgi:hypothetical protein
MFLSFRDFLAVQHPQEVSKTSESNQEFKPRTTAEYPQRSRPEPPSRIGFFPVSDDVLPLIHDTEASGLIACLVQGVLVFPINSNVPQSDTGYFLQLPAHAAAPVYAAYY